MSTEVVADQPLYSLINMIIHVYCRNSTFSATSTLADQALTFDTIPALGAAGVSVARYAGYAMMSVPFLSWGLFKYGGGALAQMSSYMGQPIQSASGMAAQEVTSGNMSFGVRNFDSTSRNNVNSFKQDENASVRSGSTSYQTPDGSNITLTSGGEQVLDKVSNMSKLGTSLTDKHEVASSMNEMSSKLLTKAHASQIGYSETTGAAYDLMKNFSNSKGNSLANDSNIGTDVALSANESIQEVKDTVASYSRLMGVDERKALDQIGVLSLGGKISASAKFPKILKAIPGVSAYFGAEGRIQGTSSDVDNLNTTSNEQLQLAQKFTEGMDKVNRVFQNDSLRNSSSEAANFSDGLNSKLSQADTHRRDVQNSLTESDAWQKSANHVSSSSFGVSNDMSQDFVKYAGAQPNPNGHAMGVDGVSDALNDPERREKLIQGYMESRKHEIWQQYGSNKLNDESSIKDAYQNSQTGTKGEQDVANKYAQMSAQVMSAKTNHGLDKPVNTEIKDKAEAQFDTNNMQFNSKAKAINERARQLEEKKAKFDDSHQMKDK